MFKDKKAIICDLDGTLIDSIGMWNDIDSTLISSFGKKPHDTIGIERTRVLSENNIGNIYENYMSYIISTYGINGQDGETMLKLRNEISKDYMLHRLKLKENADIFLQAASNLGYKLALATSSSDWALDIYRKNDNINKNIDFFSFFDYMLTSNNVKEKKPNPAVYNEAVRCINLPKREIIALEDELMGVEAAVSAGIDVICMYDKYSDHDRELINSMSTYTSDDYYTLIKKL